MYDSYFPLDTILGVSRNGITKAMYILIPEVFRRFFWGSRVILEIDLNIILWVVQS